MLTPVITGPTIQEAKEQVLLGNTYGKCLEFRLDTIHFTNVESIKRLKKLSAHPVIFTLRKQSQGGSYKGKECDHFALLKMYASLKPDMIDIDYDADTAFFKEIKTLHPDIKLIASYHNFRQTPKDLEKIFDTMQNPYADAYKIATFANSSLDALKMLKFLKGKRNVTALCMGKLGQITRILAPVYGSQIAYASLSSKSSSAPGQLSAKTLQNIYHFNALGKETKVFGLIGDPVTHSPGHITHNRVLKDLGVDGVYVKLHVTAEEVDECLTLSQELGFVGFSVTMPLKEAVMPSIHTFSPGSKEIGAVNTLHFTAQGILGRNTDSTGALDAIEEKLKVAGKHLVILGAGGVAKGIAYEAVKRGAAVCILNRTPEKAQQLANSLNCEWGGLSDYPRIAKKGYDIIVNALTMATTEHPIKDQILAKTVAMDVNYNHHETVFLRAAKSQGCTLVYGIDMYVLQAVKQFTFWLGNRVDERKVRSQLEKALSLIKPSRK